ncbi:MAG: NnrS family protein [Hyphomicrobiaceae bacterium]|nr:NnrS family protein [Hyphomicrobiaceae bacterium]
MASAPPSSASRINNRRMYNGPLFFKQGFRPFFLGAGLWSAVAMIVWLLYLTTGERFYSFGYLTPHEWHMHEMLYGFLPAAIAGFLLTAVPNWTGRLPVRGLPLALLSTLWLAGRLVMLAASIIPEPYHIIVACIDGLFLVSFALLIAREILSGKNWKNLPVVIIISALAISNIVFHLSILDWFSPLPVSQIANSAIFLAVLLVTLIGGRIVPSFTRNWMVRNKIEPLPAPLDQIDKTGFLMVGLSAFLLAFAPPTPLTGIICLLTAIVHLYRLSRWQGWSCYREPLVFILHIGYGWIAIGFTLAGLSMLFDEIPLIAAVHAFSAGMIGTMILAVMTRATRGHTGQPLEADIGTTLIFILITLSAITRVVSALGTAPQWGYTISGITWIAAFLLFSALYYPFFTKSK